MQESAEVTKMYDSARALEVLGHMNALILSASKVVASEQYAPSPNPDESDEKIKERKEFVREMREIRERFENLIAGVIL